MTNSKKRDYRAPKLILHGNVENITAESDFENADTPEGNDDTAFPTS